MLIYVCTCVHTYKLQRAKNSGIWFLFLLLLLLCLAIVNKQQTIQLEQTLVQPHTHTTFISMDVCKCSCEYTCINSMVHTSVHTYIHIILHCTFFLFSILSGCFSFLKAFLWLRKKNVVAVFVGVLSTKSSFLLAVWSRLLQYCFLLYCYFEAQ